MRAIQAELADGSAEPHVPADGSAGPAGEGGNEVETSPGEQARADALVAMARRAVTTLTDETVLAGERPHLLVHIDASALVAHADPGAAAGPDADPGSSPGACHLDGGPALAAATACRLGCEGTMAVFVDDGKGNPLHLGDTTPAVTRRQKRALLTRDHGCRFPGCGARRYLHAHHIVHWARGGPTCITNLLLLCGRHHRLVHEGGFGVVANGGRIRFTRPDRTVIANPNPTLDPNLGVVEHHAGLGLTITADTAGSRSNGARYDRGLASDALWCLIHPEHILGRVRQPLAESAA